ncbi:MAG TPA: dephospho-CoA kinase [Treponemataceae bacterium]|jgi:dephospho-CoA kinase|nr:dephospho-CoA kinase [Treponemataceae bacterium]
MLSGSKRLIIALTGPMASGKNAVSDILENEGFLCIDADTLVHKAIENKKDTILSVFTSAAEEKKINLVHPEGTINRRNLGSLVFSSPELLAAQEGIIHPEVDRIINEFIDGNPEKSIVINATVLYKTPVIKRCSFILFVTAPVITRFFRVLRRDSMPVMQILKRFSAQKHIFAKYRSVNADMYIVRNFGSRNSLKKKILNILQGNLCSQGYNDGTK